MFNSIRDCLWSLRSKKARRAEEQKSFDSVFALPKSADGLAELLSELAAQHQVGSTKYILAEHALNMLLAKVQSKATLNAGWLGAGATLLAVLMSAALGYIAGTSQPKEPNEPKCEKTTTSHTSQPDSKASAVVSEVVAPTKEISVAPLSSDHGQNAGQPGNGRPNP